MSDAEAAWLMEYVCAVRTMRADLLTEVRDGKLALDEMSKRQKEEREALLTDLEKLLGPERYARLREVGGLGKLPDLVHCE